MRHPNYRLVKTKRTYTVEEVARLLGVHRNTVRQWIKQGLPTCDDRRPILILGHHLRAFLEDRRRKHRHKCSAGELYCVRCRLPRTPAGLMADYIPDRATLGTLVGICPICGGLIYRKVNPARIDQIRGSLEIRYPKGGPDIDESLRPFVNSDFGGREQRGET